MLYSDVLTVLIEISTTTEILQLMHVVLLAENADLACGVFHRNVAIEVREVRHHNGQEKTNCSPLQPLLRR